jgi:hypothetical protein
MKVKATRIIGIAFLIFFLLKSKSNSLINQILNNLSTKEPDAVTPENMGENCTIP